MSVKTWFVVHKWTSLICTLFMLLLCVTGLPLIFHHEIDHALGHAADPPPLTGAAGPASIDGIIEDAKSRKPGHAVQFLMKDLEEPDLVFIALGETINAAESSAFYTYDGRTGSLLADYPLNQGVMSVLLRLHVDMFAGLPGTLFLGGMGLLLVASIVSGAVLYGPYMRKLRFGTVRRRRSARIKWLDLHNLLGIVTLVWLLVVGATGVINTLTIPIFGQWQSTELAAMSAKHEKDPAAEPGSGERAAAAAQAAAPDMRPSFMAFPGNRFAGSSHFVAYMQGTTAWSSQLLTPLLIDGRSGEVLERGHTPWYVTSLLVSRPLHFGNYGGLPLKILWALLDVLSIVVLGSGVYLWIKRWRGSFEAWLLSEQRDAAPAEQGVAA